MEVHCAGGGLRKMQLKVLHLDDTVHTFQLSVHATGQELHASMIDRLHLLESDYFDLEYVNEEGMRCWLDHDKPILRQISSDRDLLFRFGVKFYTPYPNLLEEEFTRYLFALQVKRDLVTGTLLCSENTAALLASYVVQAELGDFLEDEYHSIDYLRPLKLLHDPTEERLQRVMEFHKAHLGLSPSDADLALLDTARKVEFYGLRLHFVRNHEGLGLNLAVSHLGILVFQNLIRINTFSWAKIRKLSFKRKRFLVKLQPERFDSIEFLFDSREECKHFWKHCIEHHTFFRCPKAEPDLSKPGQPGQRLSRSGSTFRYTGRTEQELHEYIQEHGDHRINFERPSAARRAYSTLLSGSSYTSRRLQTASLQLRSSSADRRIGTMCSNTLGVSLTNTLGRPAGLKRAHSEGIRQSADENQNEQVVGESGECDADVAPEVPTSGYVTTTESAGSRQSTETNAVPEPEEGAEQNVERMEEEEVSEMDPLRWITETYRRMTGDWTGVLGEETQETSTLGRRAKSAAGSPRTSGTASLGRLDTELDSLLLHQQPGTATVQIAQAEDDGALTHFLFLSEISQAVVPQPSVENSLGTSQTDRQAEQSLPIQGATDQQPQPSDILSDLTGAVLLSGTNISDLVNRVVSPFREQSTEGETVRGSSSLSTTQPDLLSQADTGLAQRSSVHSTTDRMATTFSTETTTQGLPGSEGGGGGSGTSGITTFLTQATGAQAQHPTTDFFDDFNLGAGQGAVFILPTVTQYGLDINIDRGQQQIRPLDSTPTIEATVQLQTSTELPHQTGANSSNQVIASGDTATFQNYSSQLGYPYTQTSWSTVTPAYSVPSVPEPDSRQFVLASVHTEPPAYGAIHTTDSVLKDKFPSRYSKSSFGTSLLSSRSTGQIPSTGVTTTTSCPPSDGVRRSQPSAEPVQGTPFDQWSSSGSDSTTGVILRPEVSQTDFTGTNIRTSSSASLVRQHKTGCPHASSRQSHPATASMNTTASSQLPMLPVDTLPARPSHHRNMLTHTCGGHASNLSHSIPCDVHLSGLNADFAYRNPGRKVSEANKNCLPNPKISANERQLRRSNPQGYPFSGEPIQPDMVAMGVADDTTAEMLEDAPYVVIRRPRSVDVKQYQLHLQRQQQQAAALAAAAAGYPFHPGAPPFFGDTHHHHQHHAAAAYHFGGRIPVGSQFPYGPPQHTCIPPAYHHHHEAAGNRSAMPQEVNYGHSSKYHSTGPGEHRLESRQERTRQARQQQQPQLQHHHRGYPDGFDPYAPVVPMYREKCKAKRKHSKTPENQAQKDDDPNRSKRHTKPAAGVMPGDISHHHVQCMHRRRTNEPNVPDENVGKRAVMQAKRHLRPKATGMSVDTSSTQPGAKIGSTSRPQSQKKRIPVSESGESRSRRRTTEPRDDSRETEVPYPVSEILFSPSRGREPTDARQAKPTSTVRHHHHHHPACASLMGRARASQAQQDIPKLAKITTSEATLASASVPQLQTDQTRKEAALKKSTRSWASDDRYPMTERDVVPPIPTDQVRKKEQDATGKPGISDTRDTIEKLRQELRSAGFHVKDSLPSKSSTEMRRTRAMESTSQPKETKQTAKPSYKPGTKTSPSRQKPVEAAQRSTESRKPVDESNVAAARGTTDMDKPVSMVTSSALAIGMDLPFGGPPRNPIYLDSDSDSEEISGQRKVTPPDVSSKPQDPLTISKEPVSTTASTMETIEAPGGQDTVDVMEPRPIMSPRSHSPSLPLSFLPSDEENDETDVSLGSQASLLNSPDSASYCSTCDRVDSYDSLSPDSSRSCCHSHHHRRHHQSCHRYHRHQHGHYHHPHYRSHHHHHRNYVCRCHSCVSRHHRRHLSEHRYPYRESRHHTERPHHPPHRVDSSPRKHRRSTSDRRPDYSVSSSEPSEQSWTNSLSDSSAFEEFPDNLGGDDLLTVERRSLIVEQLLVQERKLRAQMEKHRALVNELKQTRQQTQKLLALEHKQPERKDDSKARSADGSVRSSSKKTAGNEVTSYKSEPTKTVIRDESGEPSRGNRGGVRRDRKDTLKSDDKHGGKQSHAVRPARHYRHLHTTRKSIGSKSTSRSPCDRSTDRKIKQTASGARKLEEQDDFVIENTAALAGGDGELDTPEDLTRDLKLEREDTEVEDKKTISTGEQLHTQMALVTLELEDIEENTLYEAAAEPQTSPCIQSVQENNTCVVTTGQVTSVERLVLVDQHAPVSEQLLPDEPPIPPPMPPPLAACITPAEEATLTEPTVAKATKEETKVESTELEYDASESKPKPQLSSINQLSDLDVSADQTDADSEYDGTHVINMLSEIIESSFSAMQLTHQPDSQDQHTTDCSTQASSVCDDTHTSEASVDTVKAAHSPTRLGSPSNSTTSASEGSEDIEPFPPPPPESLVDLYLTHEGSLTHSHLMYAGALDEVIEEEGGVGELETDVCDMSVQSDAEITLIERVTDEDKQESSSPEHKVEDSFATDEETTRCSSAQDEEDPTRDHSQLEVLMEETKQPDETVGSVQMSILQTVTEETDQSNETVFEETTQSADTANGTENVDATPRSEAELPSDALTDRDEHDNGQRVTEVFPPDNHIPEEDSPDQPLSRDTNGQTENNETVTES